jgi:tRNA(fMet)-specific endonuclease VapC
VTGYLFDTSALSAYLNPRHPYHARAVSAIDALPSAASKTIAVPTLAEIDFGIRCAEQAGSPYLAELRERLRTVREYTCLEISPHTAEEYAALKAKLAARVLKKSDGKPPRWIEDWVDRGSGKKLQIDENDLWIAAVAKERDLTVVTGDSDMRTLASIDSDVRILFAYS